MRGLEGPVLSGAGGRFPTRGDLVIRFIERYCVHVDGEWLGTPFLLRSWQKDMIREMFRIRPDGIRRYRWGTIGLPKKSGKTTLAAALGLYFLLADEEPAAMVPVAAASEDQADLVFGAARRMCQLSPRLSALTECYEREILVPSLPGSRMRRVAANAGLNDGLNISACVID